MRTKGTLPHFGGNVTWYEYYKEQYGGPLKTRNKTTVWSKNTNPGHTLGKNHTLKKVGPNVSAVLFTIAKTWKQPKCPATEE